VRHFFLGLKVTGSLLATQEALGWGQRVSQDSAWNWAVGTSGLTATRRSCPQTTHGLTQTWRHECLLKGMGD
jgi:hypothetical protein